MRSCRPERLISLTPRQRGCALSHYIIYYNYYSFLDVARGLPLSASTCHPIAFVNGRPWYASPSPYPPPSPFSSPLIVSLLQS